MDIIDKSLKIALKAHKGKKDKAGKTYILHPIRLMTQMETEEEMAVALLHDAIEDSPITKEYLLNEGIPSKVVDAVQTLSKLEDENYDDFINRIIKNNLAAKVKKADIEDNINVLRLNALSAKDLERIAKYHKAWLKLSKIK